MLVPLNSAKPFCGTEEMTLTPGAVTSGLRCSEYGVGPIDEKLATMSAGRWRPVEDAAAVMASGAGDAHVPRARLRLRLLLRARLAKVDVDLRVGTGEIQTAPRLFFPAGNVGGSHANPRLAAKGAQRRERASWQG